VTNDWVDGYLTRLGTTRPERADEETLRDLHLRHLRCVPFENLGIHLGEDIVLTDEALVGKLVDRRRGGFCYELNGAFAALLTALGYDVELLSARVLLGGGGTDGGLPYDHLALRVGPWLVDVGFGDHSSYPLRFDVTGDQLDPGGTFRLTETDDGDIVVSKDGTPEYLLETRPRQLADFRVGAWWHSTSPASHFTRSLVCSVLTETGRISLTGRKLVRTVDGHRTESVLDQDSDVLAAYRTHFGVELDRVPEVRPH
jgi:N-hydroxyarylamine O-acetyltransferase